MPSQEPPVLRFECPTCHKKLARSTTLRDHMRCHTGEKPFSCTICKEAFARNYDRKQHEQTHTLTFRFVCHGILPSGFTWGCGAGFHRKRDLTRHYRSRAGSLCRSRLREADEQKNMEGTVKVNGLPIASRTTEGDVAAAKPATSPNAAALPKDSRGLSVHGYGLQELSSPVLPFIEDHAPIFNNNVAIHLDLPASLRLSAQWKQLSSNTLIGLPAPFFLPYWLQQTTLHDTPRDAESWVLSGSVGDNDPFDKYFANFCKTNTPDINYIRDSAISQSQSAESLVQTEPGPLNSDLRDVQELDESEISGSEGEDDETWQENAEKVQAYAKIDGREWPNGEKWSYFVRELQIKIGRSTVDFGVMNSAVTFNAASDASKSAGRELPVHLAIAPHKAISRHHATIFWDAENPGEGGWHLQVHGSQGVWINGHLINRGGRQRIVSGDKFRICNTQMTFLTPDEFVKDDERSIAAQDKQMVDTFHEWSGSEFEEFG